MKLVAYTGRWWLGCYSEDGTGRGCNPAMPLLTVPNVTLNPSTASVPITVLPYNGSSLCGFKVPIKGLIVAQRQHRKVQGRKRKVGLSELDTVSSTVFASRAFYYSAPQVWNCLGTSTRSALLKVWTVRRCIIRRLAITRPQRFWFAWRLSAIQIWVV